MLKFPVSDSIIVCSVLHTSIFVTWEVICISTRFVLVSHGFFLRRSINFPEAYELLAPVSINARQVIPSTLIGIIGNIPSSLPFAVIRVFSLSVPALGCVFVVANRSRSIYQYSSMAPRFSGQNCKFFKFLLFLNSQERLRYNKNNTKYGCFTRKPPSHVRILIYRTWPIDV